jgi:quercetin dioxygenase-like cupin family protein
MKKIYGMVFVFGCAGAPLVWPAQEAKTAEAPKAAEAAPAPTLWSAADLKWTDIAAIPGARQAVLWGDPAKEGFGKLNRWTAGTEVPLHYHPFEVRGVVLEGTVTLTPEGGAAKELGPGSYWHMPGKVRHVTTCKPGADCVFLTTSRLRYETRMAPAAKAPRP